MPMSFPLRSAPVALVTALTLATASAQSLNLPGRLTHPPVAAAVPAYVPLSAAGATDAFFDGTLEHQLFFNAGLLHAPVPAAPAPMSLTDIRPTGGELINHNEIDAALTRTRQGYSSTVLPTSAGSAGNPESYGEYARYWGLIGKYTGRYESSVRGSIAHQSTNPDSSFASYRGTEPGIGGAGGSNP